MNRDQPVVPTSQIPSMRSFFQSRTTREPTPKAVQPARPPQPAAMPHPQTRAELDDGVTVSELSELEARALCAREGIAFFWPSASQSVPRVSMPS